jgi:hypothetical protein
VSRAPVLTARRVRVAVVLLAVTLASCVDTGPWPLWQKLTLPLRGDSVRFAVIGDSGTGGRQQYEVASRMAEFHERYPFDFVLMLGDNMYGGEEPEDFDEKFTRPYQALLSRGVAFYAALGNHDLAAQELPFEPFHMGGKRYYTFVKGPAQFFALDSNYMDPEQLEWLAKALSGSVAPWKICFFHHPIYSSGRRHGSEVDLRLLVEPLFVRYGVNVVFAGHEHLYERMKPQQGIHYFTSGGAGKLSRNDFAKGRPAADQLRVAGFDQDRHFMLIEIAGDQLYFQAISRTGRTIDAGTIYRGEAPVPAPAPRGSPEKRASGAERFLAAGRLRLPEVGERPVVLEDGGHALHDLRVAYDDAHLAAGVELGLP